MAAKIVFGGDAKSTHGNNPTARGNQWLSATTVFTDADVAESVYASAARMAVALNARIADGELTGHGPVVVTLDASSTVVTVRVRNRGTARATASGAAYTVAADAAASVGAAESVDAMAADGTDDDGVWIAAMVGAVAAMGGDDDTE
ncbi:MAG: hypothetical protein ACYTAF_17485 [Planctomycetota bacterium]|jgi:hypothetical protein